MLIWCGYLLVMCVFLGSCSGESEQEDDLEVHAKQKGSWTYMVYLAADNDISEAGLADVNEMEEVGSSPEVNIVVQGEFQPGGTGGPPSSTIRGRVEGDADPRQMGAWYEEIGNRNMTDPATLTEFIDWAARNYPADRYALVLWSHGSGWKDYQTPPAAAKGMFIDLTSAGRHTMTPLTDLARAVRESGVVFDVINFDTCLMGMFEVAYEFRGTADYLVFSEGLYPAYGDSYHTILRELVNAPDMDGFLLARITAAKCREFYEQLSSGGLIMTKSALDLSGIERFQQDLCRLAELLCSHMETERPRIEEARDASVDFEYQGSRDLGSFLQQLSLVAGEPEIKTMSRNLADTLSGMIIGNEVSGMARGTEVTGMAIYFPDQYQALGDDLTRYSALACNRTGGITWGSLVSMVLTGDPLPDAGEVDD